MRPRRIHRGEPLAKLLLLLLVIGPVQTALAVEANYRSTKYPDYAAWRAACIQLPSYRILLGKAPSTRLETALPSFSEVEITLKAAFNLFRNGSMGLDANWVGSVPKMNEFFDPDRAYFLRPPIPFQPFAQKLKLPAGSEVVFHGDFHGDIHSFIAMLDSLNQAEILDGFRLVCVLSWVCP